MDFLNKKILILGGAFQHCKLVKAAKEMGLFVIVTDNLSLADSPAKRIADEAWDLSIYSVEEIVKKCKEERIDGIASAWLDPCQRPYAQICENLGLPAYGTTEQFIKMTDKILFKEVCKKYGVDVIPDYSVEDCLNRNISFPVFVKPVDSRGSRGQTICYNYEELEKGLEFARKESSNGQVLVEKYMEKVNEFHVTYFFVDGEPHLLRASDNYCGPKTLKMEKVVSCAVYPSRYIDHYIATAHKNVVAMFKSLGIKNGPIFMQGFKDGDKYRFFDPGLRFPGVDCELVFKKALGIDLMKAMIEIALTGKCNLKIPPDAYRLNSKVASVLYLNVKPGTIKTIRNEEQITNNPAVVSYLPRCKVGDQISWCYNVNQRFAEIDLMCDTKGQMMNLIDNLQNKIFVGDANDQNLIFNRFDTKRIE